MCIVFCFFCSFFLTGQKVKPESGMCVWKLNALDCQMGKEVL